MKIRLAFAAVALLAGPSPAFVYHGAALAPDGENAWTVTIDTVMVWHSTDGGSGWGQQSIATIRTFFDVFALNSSQAWTCGMIGDIWHTSDGGENWARQNLGGPKFATRLQFVDANYGWAAGGEAILMRSTNGGSEWILEFFPNPPYPSSIVDFQGLAMLGPQSGWLAAGRFPEGDSFWSGQGYLSHVWADGDTFVKQLVRQDTMYDFFDVDFTDSLNGWVVGGYDRDMSAVVLRTSDGGANWAEQPLPPSTRYLRAVEFVDGMNGWACGRSGTIIHTTNGGADWESQYCPSDTTLFDIDFSDTQRGLAVGNSIVLYTTDGGAHWIRSMGGILEPAANRAPEIRPLVLAAGNPSRGAVRFEAGTDARVLTLHDALGRPVRRLAGKSRGGSVVFSWDGRDESGRPVESGLYLARTVAGREEQTVVFTYLEE